MHGIAPAWASLRRRISVVGSFRGMPGIISRLYQDYILSSDIILNRIGILYVFCDGEDF